MTVTTSPERTGQFTAVWRADGTFEEQADEKVTFRVDVLELMPRVPGRPDVLLTPGGNQYFIGGMHGERPFERYVHRITPPLTP